MFRKNYSKYGLESRLHFRVHSGIEVLKSRKKSKQNNAVTVADNDSDEFDDISNEQFDETVTLNEPSTTVVNGMVDSVSDSGESRMSKDNVASVKNPTSPSQAPPPTKSLSKTPSTSSSNHVNSPSITNVKSTSNDVTPFQTPSTSPILSEASSSISPKHTYMKVKDSPRFNRETAI